MLIQRYTGYGRRDRGTKKGITDLWKEGTLKVYLKQVKCFDVRHIFPGPSDSLYWATFFSQKAPFATSSGFWLQISNPPHPRLLYSCDFPLFQLRLNSYNLTPISSFHHPQVLFFNHSSAMAARGLVWRLEIFFARGSSYGFTMIPPSQPPVSSTSL